MWDVRRMLYTLRKALQTTSALSATSKLCFEQPAASFLVCFLIFIEYKIKKVSEKATAPAVAFIILLNSVLVLHLRYGYSSVS